MKYFLLQEAKNISAIEDIITKDHLNFRWDDRCERS